ncbi:MAG TPA: ABC transporter permease [Gammaproteobacteria bacterium]
MVSALKRLLRHPGYFVTLVLVMATGLGGALSLYGISDAVLFRPLNVANAETLLRIFRTDEGREQRDNWSIPGVRDYLGNVEAFEDVAWYAEWPQVAHTAPGMDKTMLNATLVSGNFFTLLGARPAEGRLLQPDDDVRGAGIVGVLSYETWQSRFNGEPGIVGDAITLNGEPVTIAGIAPPGFTGVSLTNRPNIWLPVNSATPMALPAMPTEQFLTSENMAWLNAVARLAPGVTVGQARASLETARLARGDGEEAWPAALVFPARDVAIDPSGKRNIETVSWILFGLVAVLLIVVCADAAGLMLVRAEAARAETGVRLSLGATRARVARDVLREAVIVVVLAAALALLFALLLSGWLQRNIGAELALPDEPGVLIFNARVLPAFAGMLAIAALLSSIAPIRRLGATRLADVLRGARHGDTGGALNVRDGLIVVQVGVSVLLLTVSMMFIGALRETLAVDPGFRTDNRGVAFLVMMSSDHERPPFVAVLQALREDPRVTRSAVALNVPVSRVGMRRTVRPQDYSPAANEDMQVAFNPVSDGYFDALAIDILRGRDFTGEIAGMTGDEPEYVIVNQAFAERYWPDRNAVGMRIDYGIDESAEVIAVVANNKQSDLREAPRPMVFTTFRNTWTSALNVIAAAPDAGIAMNAIRDAVATAGPEVAIQAIGSMEARMDRLTQRDRAMTSLAVGAAVFATLLAVVGMYGVAAYAARQRQREIGIRYALGATRPQVTRQFLRRGLVVALFGIGAGLLLTVFASRHLAGAVAGVEQGNSFAMLFSGLLFAAVAVFANLVPVWRAANVAPMEVLRDE